MTDTPESSDIESSEQNLTLDEKFARTDYGKSPRKKFNAEKGTLEYADENLQKLQELRKKMHFSNRDPLTNRQREIELGLEEIGFEKSDMGKTGDSRTGEVTDRHKKIADSQVEDAKADIIRTRLAQGKKIIRQRMRIRGKSIVKLYLKYIPEFDVYGIEKRAISDLALQNEIAEILLPEELKYVPDKSAPTVGFLLGQDKSEAGEEYYSISKSYLQAMMNTGVKIRFLDYENPYKQMKNCHGAVLPGGAFNNPESFYIDGKVLGDEVGKRYFAYRAVIAEAYKKHKPLLGICAGAQMIGSLLGNMKMYRSLKDEVLHPAVHKPKEDTDVRVHQIKLLKNTPIFEIMGIDTRENHVIINSRHNQSMVQGVLQDYVVGTPKIKMNIYAISDSDSIPEIWGNEQAGILCVQGHPEDLVSDQKMQNLYNYIALRAKKYQTNQNLKVLSKDENTR